MTKPDIYVNVLWPNLTCQGVIIKSKMLGFHSPKVSSPRLLEGFRPLSIVFESGIFWISETFVVTPFDLVHHYQTEYPISRRVPRPGGKTGARREMSCYKKVVSSEHTQRAFAPFSYLIQLAPNNRIIIYASSWSNLGLPPSISIFTN